MYDITQILYDDLEYCVATALEIIKSLDSKGKKGVETKGSDREQATKYFDKLQQIVERECGYNSEINATICLELARQLESRHQDQSRMESSKWNRSANIAEDEFSSKARMYYQKAELVFSRYPIRAAERANALVGVARLSKNTPNMQGTFDEGMQVSLAQSQKSLQYLREALIAAKTLLSDAHEKVGDLYYYLGSCSMELGLNVM